MKSPFDQFAVNLEMWWPHLPRLDRVREAADTGFRLAEIWFWPNWDIPALARLVDECGITITQIGGWDFEPRFHERANRALFRDGISAAIDVAISLGTSRINLNGPCLEPGETAAQVVFELTEALRSVVDVAEAAGVTLMVEPMNVRVDHPGYSIPTSSEAIDVCRSVGSSALGVNWDLYHLQISEGDLSGHLVDGIEYVSYVQVADHPGRHEPGTGEIDYAHVLANLADLGYGGPIGLECSPQVDAERALARLEVLVGRIRERPANP